MAWISARVWLLAVALGGGGICLGCGTTVGFLQTHDPPRPWVARPPESVEILAAGPPGRPHVEVGILEAQQSSAYTVDPPDVVLTKMRQRAAQLGCDAIVLTGGNDGFGYLVPNGSPIPLKGYRGVCLMYPDGPMLEPAKVRVRNGGAGEM